MPSRVVWRLGPSFRRKTARPAFALDAGGGDTRGRVCHRVVRDAAVASVARLGLVLLNNQ